MAKWWQIGALRTMREGADHTRLLILTGEGFAQFLFILFGEVGRNDLEIILLHGAPPEDVASFAIKMLLLLMSLCITCWA